MSLSNEQILEGIKRKDRNILSEIYHEYLPMITKMVMDNSGSRVEAKDVFQEGLIVLFEKINSSEDYEGITFGAYMRVVCKNLWFQQLRRKKKVTSKSVEIDEPSGDLNEEITNDMMTSGRYKLFREHFQKIGSDCQKVLTMFLNKVSLREIALKMEFTEQYAKKRKYKCQKKLIESIQSDMRFQELKY